MCIPANGIFMQLQFVKCQIKAKELVFYLIIW